MQHLKLKDAEILASELIRTSTMSVSLAANLFSSFPHSLTPVMKEVGPALLNFGRRLRFALGARDLTASSLGKTFLDRTADQLQGSAWAIRIVPPLGPGQAYLISDERIALISARGLQRRHEQFFLAENRHRLRVECAAFEEVWASGKDLQFIYSDQEDTPEAHGDIVRVSREQWSRVISALQNTPDLLYNLDSRVFEGLVAELLARDGAQVELTPASRDGGKDILAWLDTPFGPHLYLVECKRYARENRVGVGLVRQLYGVVEQTGSTAGLLVTTSQFTNPAVKFTETVQNRIKLRDYEALVDWIKRTR